MTDPFIPQPEDCPTGTDADGALPRGTASLLDTSQWRECDICFLLTAREAEKQGVVLTDDFPEVRLCQRHDGSHNITSWIESHSAGWFQCSCGAQFSTGGFESEDASMGALIALHREEMAYAGAHNASN